MAKSKKAKKPNTSASTPSATSTSSPEQQRAGFFRRLAAMIYDTLVATAVGMCAAMAMIVFMVVSLKNGVFDMQGYAEPNEFIQNSVMFTTIIQVWVGVWVAGFFLWFWKRGGQTLGMRAWRLRIFSTTEAPMTWSRLLLRLVTSLGGLGTLLVLFDVKNKLALQDWVAKTEVVKLTKNQNDHKSW